MMHLHTQIACGMDGVISVAANSFPDRFVDMVHAALKQDFKMQN